MRCNFNAMCRRAFLVVAMLCALGFTCEKAVAQTNQPGRVDTNFNPTESFLDLNAVTAQPDGKVVIGFGSLHSWETPVARLNPDGARDVGFTTGVPRFFNVFLQLVTSVALDSSGKILFGGFGYVPDFGWAGWSLRRLDADGSNAANLGEGFSLPPFNTALYCLHVQADGKILAGGRLFNNYNPSVYLLTRFNADGAGDSGFQSTLGNGSALTVTSQADGKILVGGGFSDVNGASRNCLARLLADGTLDASFYGSGPTNGCNGDVRAIVLLPDGKILLAGGFTSVHGVSRPHLARLNPDGSLDPSFPSTPPPDARIFAMVLQGDGRILIAGEFMTVGGLSRPRVARLNADGSVDETFDPGTGPNAPVYGMALLPDGDIVIIGSFSSVDGVPRPQIARLKTYVLRFEPLARLPNGQIRLVVHGRPATRFILQASADLQSWFPLSTNTLTTTTSELTDTNTAPAISRFYRGLTVE